MYLGKDKMNNQNQTKESLFTEIKLDEAANVNGGSYFNWFFSLNPSNFRLRNTLPRRGSSNFGRYDRNLNGMLSVLRNNGIRV